MNEENVRTDAKTNVELVQKLVLGTVQLGMPYGINNNAGQPSNDEAFEILRTAFQHGIRTLDTADAYGSAMERIGEFHTLEARNNAASGQIRFNIITKFHAEATTNLLQKTPKTLANLDVPSLWCYQFHRFSDVAAFPHIHEHLLELKQRRVIERIGVSVYTNEELHEAAEHSLIDVIQLPFNVLDNMRLRGDGMRKAKAAGKELHTRSVFLQGLFFKPLEQFPPTLQALVPYIEDIREISAHEQIALSALALNYVLHNSLIDAVLFGVETPAQLVEILGSVQAHIEASLVERIEKICVQDPSLLNPATWKR
ncbi:MAG: aldo/keto reductase [Candidatus Kapaibacterium sp.]|nr:MAG: aldo/keto reductase [Candidatus Kapabacteria bacterium]